MSHSKFAIQNSSFSRYPKYKDSGVEWLGEVPEHWERRPLQSVSSTEDSIFIDGDWIESKDISDSGIRYLTSGNVGAGSYKEQGQGFITADTFESLNCTDVFPGDILISRLNLPIGRACIVPNLESRIVTCVDNVIVRPDPFYDRRFVVYLLSSKQHFANTDNLGRGSTMKRISRSILGKVRFSFPPLPEQTAIAAFLDRETAKIDGLVAEQRRLMELLKEKRQAVISHAVTKGLNPDAPMKPSGIEWLGDVPEHWEVMPLKRFFRLVAESAPPNNDHQLLSIYTEIGVRPRKSLEAKGNKATTTDGYWIVKKGDLIVNKLLAWMGAIGISDYEGVTSPAYDILRKRIPLEPRFYDFLLRCGICFAEFRRWSRGIMDMRLRLYFDQLGQLPMPFPPVDEQCEIVKFLEHEIGRFDALSAEAQRAIDLLQERRTALISAAVTGQIDVRGLEPSPPQ